MLHACITFPSLLPGNLRVSCTCAGQEKCLKREAAKRKALADAYPSNEDVIDDKVDIYGIDYKKEFGMPKNAKKPQYDPNKYYGPGLDPPITDVSTNKTVLQCCHSMKRTARGL